MLSRAVIAGFAMSGLCAASVSAHPFGWRIGQNDSGDLEIWFLFDVTHTAFRVDDDYSGIIDDSLSFQAWPGMNAEDPIVRIDAEAEIYLEVIGFDAGVRLHDIATGDVFENAGEMYFLGTGQFAFDTDPIWQIDPGAEGFVLQDIYEAQFRVHDLSGAHGSSPIYTFRMGPDRALLPGPGVIGVFAAAGFVAARRCRVGPASSARR